jgi:hypothetical protein
MKHIFYFAMLLVSYGLFTGTFSALAQNAVQMDKTFEGPSSNFLESNIQPAGEIKVATPVLFLTAAQVKAFALGSLPDPALIPLVEAVFNFDYDIVVWKIVYTSRNIAGELVDVSGLIIVPQGLSEPVPIGSYAHGTIFADIEAPSHVANVLNNDQTAIGLAFATGGYIMFLSDYQAHGDSEGEFSLYVAQLEAHDILNGLRATQSFCIGNDIALNGNVSLFGFSQGGHAVLAAQRAMEQYPIEGLDLLVNIAGAGPYDLSGVQLQFLLNNPQYSNPAIIAGITEGYQNVYGNIYKNGQPPYAEPFLTVPDLYNRQLTRDEINQQLIALGLNAWTDMYQAAFLRSLKFNFAHPLRVDLRLNNVYDWRPKQDVKLCYCSEDELVSPLNTFRALLGFYLKGAFNARAIPLGPYGHFQCAPYATLYAKLIFDLYNGRFDNLVASARKEDPHQLLGKQINLKEYDWLALKNYLGQDITFDSESLEEQYAVDANTRVMVYPNPVNDLAHLQLPFTDDGTTLQLYDHTGRLVKSMTAYTSDFMLDVTDIPDGLYFVKINGDQQLSVRMIVRK